MNKVIMMGRFGKDPEVRYTNGEQAKAVASFSLAVDRRYSKEKQADFFSCTAWGKTAEFVEKYFRKGMKALIEGRLENESWTDKEGQKRQATKIIVEQIEFAEKKQAEAPAQTDGFMDIPDEEELPFKF